MSKKINLQDLSALLAEKAAITKEDAELFLREYFEVMNEELIKSGLLKIKDLGTFKLSLTNDKESVDATTGEKIFIPAHYKVVFSTDERLAETINQPFDQIETTEIDESVLEDLELFTDDDTLEESGSGLEKREEEFACEEEADSEEEPTDKDMELGTDGDLPSIPDWRLKSLCLSCRDFEGYRYYRDKYYRSRKKMKRLRAVIYLLSILLIAVIGYPVYTGQWEKLVPFSQTSQDKKANKSKLEQDSVDLIFDALSGSAIPKEMQINSKASQNKNNPTPSDKPKQITVTAGHRLTSIALEEYGDKVFWIYVYLENKALISNPNVLPVGSKITIPSASKYEIDCNNPASIQKARDVAAKNS